MCDFVDCRYRWYNGNCGIDYLNAKDLPKDAQCVIDVQNQKYVNGSQKDWLASIGSKDNYRKE